GTTEFQFQMANLNFHSTSYDWLVIAGARAQYKGTGTINGAGNYGFILTAIDGQLPGGGGQDKFRIRIWNKANGGDENTGSARIYDNKNGSPNYNSNDGTALGGGSIVIHANNSGTGGGLAPAPDGRISPTEDGLPVLLADAF